MKDKKQVDIATYLANERTYLAYIRTFLGFSVEGIACINFIEDKRFVQLDYVISSKTKSKKRNLITNIYNNYKI